MPKVELYNLEGRKNGEFELNEKVFGFPVNEPVIHQMVLALLANRRQGTQNAKTRAEVSGGGRKPWRQKGTGQARQGSTRSPQWVKGGIVFAPKPRSYRMSIPKSMKIVAMKSALSSKVKDNSVMILEDIVMDAPKTKTIVGMLKNMDVKKALIVTGESNQNAWRSARNIPGVSMVPSNNINVYDIMKYDTLILTKDAVKKIEEVYA